MGSVTPNEKASKLFSHNSQFKNHADKSTGMDSSRLKEENLMKEILEIKIRKAIPNDLDFITASWLNSAYDTQKRDLKKDVFFPNHNRMIKERLPFMKCLVACNPEDEDQIYGYIVYNRPGILHFGYTKSYYRRFGVFARLLAEATIQPPITVTHKAPSYKILEGKYSFMFNPYLFIEVKNESSES